MSTDDNEGSFHSLLPEITVGMHDVESPNTPVEDLEQYCSPSQYPLDDHDGFLNTSQRASSPVERRKSTGELEHEALNRCRTTVSEPHLPRPPDRNAVVLFSEAMANLHLDAIPNVRSAVVASASSSVYFSMHDTSFSSDSNQNPPNLEPKLPCLLTPKDAKLISVSQNRVQNASQPLSEVAVAAASTGAPINAHSSASEKNVPFENPAFAKRLSSPGAARNCQSEWPELLHGSSRLDFGSVRTSWEKDEHVEALAGRLRGIPGSLVRRMAMSEYGASEKTALAATDDEADWPDPEDRYSSLQSSRSSAESDYAGGLKLPLDLDYFRDKPRGEPMGSENEWAVPVTNSSMGDRLAFTRSSANPQKSVGVLASKLVAERRSEGSDDSSSDEPASCSFAVPPVQNSILRSFWLRDCIEGADNVEEQLPVPASSSSQREIMSDFACLTEECDAVVDHEGNVRPPLVGQSEEGIPANLPFQPQASLIQMDGGSELPPNARSASDEEMTSSASKDSLAVRVSSLLTSAFHNVSGTRVGAEDFRTGKARPGACLNAEYGPPAEAGRGRTEQNLNYASEVEESDPAADVKGHALPKNLTPMLQRDQFLERSGYHLVAVGDDARTGLQLESNGVEHAGSRGDFPNDQRASSPSVMSVSSVASSKRLEWDSGADVGYGGPKVMYGLSTLERMAIGSCCSAVRRMEPEGKSSLVKDVAAPQMAGISSMLPSQLPAVAADPLDKFGDGIESSESDLDCGRDIVRRNRAVDRDDTRPAGKELVRETLENGGFVSDDLEEEREDGKSLVERYREELEVQDVAGGERMALPENGEVDSAKLPHSRIALLESKGLRSSSLTDLTVAVGLRKGHGEAPDKKMQHSCSISDILEGKRAVRQHVGNWGSISSTASALSSHSSKTVVGMPSAVDVIMAPILNPFCSTAVNDSGNSCTPQGLSFHTPSYEVNRDRAVVAGLTFTVADRPPRSYVQQSAVEVSGGPGQTQTSGSSVLASREAVPPSISSNSVSGSSERCASNLGELEFESAQPPDAEIRLQQGTVKNTESSVRPEGRNPESCIDTQSSDDIVAFTKAFVAKLCPGSDVQRKQRLFKKILEDFGVILSEDDNATTTCMTSLTAREPRRESHLSNPDAKKAASSVQLPLETSPTTACEETFNPREVVGGFEMLLPRATVLNPFTNVEAKNKPQSFAILKPYSPPNSNFVFYAPVNIQDFGNVFGSQLSNKQDVRQPSVLYPGPVSEAGNSSTLIESALREMGVVHSSAVKCDLDRAVANGKVTGDTEKKSNKDMLNEPVGRAQSESRSSCSEARHDRQMPGFFSSGSVISNSTLLERLPANGGSATTLESSKERPTDIAAAFSLESRDGPRAPPTEMPFFRRSVGHRLSTNSSNPVSSALSLGDSSAKLWQDGNRFRDKTMPTFQVYSNSSGSTANESASQHQKSRYAYRSTQQRISYTSESSTKDTSDRSRQQVNCISSSRRFIQRLQTVDSVHPEGLGLVKELIRQQRKSYIKKLQKEVLWLERIEAILHGTEVNFNSIPREYGDSRSSYDGNTVRSSGLHTSPSRSRSKKSPHSKRPAQFIKLAKETKESGVGQASGKKEALLETKAFVKQTKDFGQSFPTPLPTDVETVDHLERQLFTVGVQTSFESPEVPPSLGIECNVHFDVTGKDRPVISIPLTASKKGKMHGVLSKQKCAADSNSSNIKSRLMPHQKPSSVSKLGSEMHKRRPVAWFLPFDDAHPRRLQLHCGSDRMAAHGGHNAPQRESQIESLLPDDPQSLQEIFRLKRSDVIERLISRQQKIILGASRSKNGRLPIGHDVRAFKVKSKHRKYTVPLSMSTQHHNPQSRNLTHYEMREQTEKVYQCLPEVADKKEFKKREDIYKTNRLMAHVYKKKLQQKVLKGQVSMLNTQKCL